MRQTDAYEGSVSGWRVVWSRATAAGPVPAPQSKVDADCAGIAKHAIHDMDLERINDLRGPPYSDA